MQRRLPWILALPLAFGGSWIAHAVGRALVGRPAGGTEASAHLERATTGHAGAVSLGVAAVLAPFLAIALVLFGAWWWTRARGRAWRGAGPGWFLVLPALAYVSGELLERLTSGGTEVLTLHAMQEPGLLLALALQVPFGAAAYALARLLLAAARTIVSKVRGPAPDTRRRQRADVPLVVRIAPARWSCLVGAHGLRGPPVLLPL
ncbi:MAG: hypothetical protein HY240_02415 [Actinobacteria bacterium]|nr:hypothetical protein [Actinomycetota bacterium]